VGDRDLYTGPLTVAARLPDIQTGQPGGVIMLGLAYLSDRPMDKLTRIRIEMSAEDASDLLRHLVQMIHSARGE
jgi:hypothetical protein